MSVATPAAPLPARATARAQSRQAPSVASSSSTAAPSPTARPVAARPAASSRPPTKPNPAAVSTTSVKSAKSSGTAPTPSSSSAAFLVPGKDTSSSSGKVFAKPSKEWVLPERAKPGRKVSVEEPDSKRQSQNRLSQRAHRARRTDYISTLEDRIRQFENDEIHSNVRLQEVARALKADNERLKAELLSLRAQDRISPESITPKGWEEERGMLLAEIRMLKEDIKRLKTAGLGVLKVKDRGGSMSVTPHPASPIAPGPVINGIRHIADCPICPDPDPDCPCQKTAGTALAATLSHNHAHDHAISPSSSHFLQHAHAQPHQHQHQHQRQGHMPDLSIPLGSAVGLDSPPTTITCGFCQSTDECLCRMIEEEDVKPIIITPPTETMRLLDDGCGLCADGGFCACAVARNSPGGLVTSISPIVSTSPRAAMPLKKLKSNGTARKSIWTLDSGVVPASGAGATAARAEAVCSGDPRNCDACRNDSFGQEFCSNFFQSTDPTHSCTKCKGSCSSASAGPSTRSQNPKYWISNNMSPTPTQATVPPPGGSLAPPSSLHGPEQHGSDSDLAAGPLLLSCCGNPGLCGHQSGGCAGDVIGIGGLIPGLPEKDVEKETISVDQAWKTLKAHPNVKFASLAFLADVVAQRTVPTAPGSPRSATATTSSSPGPSIRDAKRDSAAAPSKLRSSVSVLAGPDPEEGDGTDTKGKRKMVVETSAVRDALRLLDGTPAPSDTEDEARDPKRPRIL